MSIVPAGPAGPAGTRPRVRRGQPGIGAWSERLDVDHPTLTLARTYCTSNTVYDQHPHLAACSSDGKSIGEGYIAFAFGDMTLGCQQHCRVGNLADDVKIVGETASPANIQALR